MVWDWPTICLSLETTLRLSLGTTLTTICLSALPIIGLCLRTALPTTPALGVHSF